MVYFAGCKDKPSDQNNEVFQLVTISANDLALSDEQVTSDVSVDALFKIEFSSSVDPQTVSDGIELLDSEQDTSAVLTFDFEEDDRRIKIKSKHNLDWETHYQLRLTNSLQSAGGTNFSGAEYAFLTKKGQLEIHSASINEKDLLTASDVREIPYDNINAEFTFSEPLDEQQYQQYFNVYPSLSVDYSLSGDGQTVTLTNTEELDYYRHYKIRISSNLTSTDGFEFDGYEASFQTGLNPTQKLPELTDEELLDKVQRETFKYFWDFAHPVSGLARERNSSGETVTTGGSGFGLMAIIVGVHRGFITRNQAINRLQKIVDFLQNDADRFHGVWPHWMDGSTGDVIPFSNYDDGGDLVETSYMAQGLIAVREFLNAGDTTENELITDINSLLDSIEWDWYTRDQDVLYWHWSPNHGWEMNMQVKGYNECLITYVMAASSTTHSIDAEAYHQGWASSGNIKNGNAFYGYELPVGYDYGGPLFFSHYSFLGLDPRNLSDEYVQEYNQGYFTQNKNHSLINYEHSVQNPNNFVGYSADSWGLTASDEQGGYGVHEPTNDNGTITPTAAVSSIPYTPDESMLAIEHFYYVLGDKLWGEYGFYDAFNPTEGWWADSYLAIDQGPIIIMIENHRSGLLWDLFMDAPEVQDGLDKLGFTFE